jgi:hypothetical protein
VLSGAAWADALPAAVKQLMTSQTAPAKFLVFIIKEKGAPTTRAAAPP